MPDGAASVAHSRPHGSMTDNISKPIVCVSIVLSSILVFISVDIFLPSLPYLPDVFGTTIAKVQMSLAYSTVALACGLRVGWLDR